MLDTEPIWSESDAHERHGQANNFFGKMLHRISEKLSEARARLHSTPTLAIKYSLEGAYREVRSTSVFIYLDLFSTLRFQKF